MHSSSLANNNSPAIAELVESAKKRAVRSCVNDIFESWINLQGGTDVHTVL